jgi:hypothetical protein
VLTAIALIPSAPVLVPELASGAAAELAELRDAVRAAVRALPQRWVAIGVGAHDEVIGSHAVGTFGGYGADVRVALSHGANSDVARLPLCALMTGWVRGEAAPDATAQVRVYSDALEAAEAGARGRALRTELDAAADDIGLLVVADGAHTLIPSAPGGYDPDAAAEQARLDDALGAGDVSGLRELPADVTGRVAYQVLAGLSEPPPAAARELFRGAPYGVGYFVGVWDPAA